MGIGLSLILIAAGAILRFAVTLHSSPVNWNIVGDVLMGAGALGIAASLIWSASFSRRGGATVIER